MAKVAATPALIANTSAGATGVGPLNLTAASAKRYGAKAHSQGNAAYTYQLNATGVAIAQAGGRNAHGRLTLMGVTALAVYAAGNGQPASVGAVTALMQTPAYVAMLAATKGNGHHVTATTPPCAKLVSGYVGGLCRASGAMGIVAKRVS